MKSETLIVVAAYDDNYRHNLETFTGGDVVVMDTSRGGHPSKAFIDAYRRYYYRSYLFLQDSITGQVDDVVQPFRDEGHQVVAWGTFPLFFDDPQQAEWVIRQYPIDRHPKHGIFGPVFYATRKAMKRLEDKGRFPETPANKHQACGTERAWAFAFEGAGIPVGALGGVTTNAVQSNLFPEDKTFVKTFGGRQ